MHEAHESLGRKVILVMSRLEVTVVNIIMTHTTYASRRFSLRTVFWCLVTNWKLELWT